jgi:hypothetical protein
MAEKSKPMASKFSGALKDIVDAGTKVKSAFLKVVQEIDVVIVPDAQKYAPELEALANALVPGSSTIVATGLVALEDLAAAIDKGGAAAKANLLNAGLDSATIAAAEALIPQLKAAVANKAAAAPAAK